MNFLNNDFGASDVTPQEFRAHFLTALASGMPGLTDPAALEYDEKHSLNSFKASEVREGEAGPLETLCRNTLVLSHRTAINYSRNLLAYGVRAGMYAGMGLMLAYVSCLFVYTSLLLISRPARYGFAWASRIRRSMTACPYTSTALHFCPS